MAFNKQPVKSFRIGIYAGTFDPVHAGHIAFALQALAAADLDEVIFMPERRPRYKPGVEHYAHRVAMIKRALVPHAKFSVMETVDRYFSVRRTLPLLRGLFPQAELVFLMGSDTVLSLPDWQGSVMLLQNSELLVGVRTEHTLSVIDAFIRGWDVLPNSLQLVDSVASEVSSSQIRQAIRINGYSKGLLASVQKYARREWLYVTPGSVGV